MYCGDVFSESSGYAGALLRAEAAAHCDELFPIALWRDESPSTLILITQGTVYEESAIRSHLEREHRDFLTNEKHEDWTADNFVEHTALRKAADAYQEEDMRQNGWKRGGRAIGLDRMNPRRHGMIVELQRLRQALIATVDKDIAAAAERALARRREREEKAAAERAARRAAEKRALREAGSRKGQLLSSTGADVKDGSAGSKEPASKKPAARSATVGGLAGSGSARLEAPGAPPPPKGSSEDVNTSGDAAGSKSKEQRHGRDRGQAAELKERGQATRERHRSEPSGAGGGGVSGAAVAPLPPPKGPPAAYPSGLRRPPRIEILRRELERFRERIVRMCSKEEEELQNDMYFEELQRAAGPIPFLDRGPLGFSAAQQQTGGAAVAVGGDPRYQGNLRAVSGGGGGEPARGHSASGQHRDVDQRDEHRRSRKKHGRNSTLEYGSPRGEPVALTEKNVGKVFAKSSSAPKNPNVGGAAGGLDGGGRDAQNHAGVIAGLVADGARTRAKVHDFLRQLPERPTDFAPMGAQLRDAANEGLADDGAAADVRSARGAGAFAGPGALAADPRLPRGTSGRKRSAAMPGSVSALHPQQFPAARSSGVLLSGGAASRVPSMVGGASMSGIFSKVAPTGSTTLPAASSPSSLPGSAGLVGNPSGAANTPNLVPATQEQLSQILVRLADKLGAQLFAALRTNPPLLAKAVSSEMALLQNAAASSGVVGASSSSASRGQKSSGRRAGGGLGQADGSATARSGTSRRGGGGGAAGSTPSVVGGAGTVGAAAALNPGAFFFGGASAAGGASGLPMNPGLSAGSRSGLSALGGSSAVLAGGPLAQLLKPGGSSGMSRRGSPDRGSQRARDPESVVERGRRQALKQHEMMDQKRKHAADMLLQAARAEKSKRDRADIVAEESTRAAEGGLEASGRRRRKTGNAEKQPGGAVGGADDDGLSLVREGGSSSESEDRPARSGAPPGGPPPAKKPATAHASRQDKRDASLGPGGRNDDANAGRDRAASGSDDSESGSEYLPPNEARKKEKLAAAKRRAEAGLGNGTRAPVPSSAKEGRERSSDTRGRGEEKRRNTQGPEGAVAGPAGAAARDGREEENQLPRGDKDRDRARDKALRQRAGFAEKGEISALNPGGARVGQPTTRAGIDPAKPKPGDKFFRQIPPGTDPRIIEIIRQQYPAEFLDALGGLHEEIDRHGAPLAEIEEDVKREMRNRSRYDEAGIYEGSMSMDYYSGAAPKVPGAAAAAVVGGRARDGEGAPAPSGPSAASKRAAAAAAAHAGGMGQRGAAASSSTRGGERQGQGRAQAAAATGEFAHVPKEEMEEIFGEQTPRSHSGGGDHSPARTELDSEAELAQAGSRASSRSPGGQRGGRAGSSRRARAARGAHENSSGLDFEGPTLSEEMLSSRAASEGSRMEDVRSEEGASPASAAKGAAAGGGEGFTARGSKGGSKRSVGDLEGDAADADAGGTDAKRRKVRLSLV